MRERSPVFGSRCVLPAIATLALAIAAGCGHRPPPGPAGPTPVGPITQYEMEPIKITAVLRRNGEKGAGFNLKYESTTGVKGAEGWYTIPAGAQWTTRTWTIPDPQFVGKWGYHFSFDSDSTQNSNYSLVSVTVTKE